MNWDAVAGVAELLGAIGVIASVLYLAVQVRSSIVATKAAAGDAAIRAFREVLRPIVSDQGMTKLFEDIFADFEALEGIRRQQAFHLMFQVVKALESIHYHYYRGLLDSGAWAGWESVMLDYFNTPGFHTYWSIRKGIYSEEFQAWVSSRVTHIEGSTAADL
jgi:hypothetical protein